MSSTQLAYQIADSAFAATGYEPYVPIHKREPDHEECTFEYRPGEGPGEGPDEVVDDNRWTCLRTYELTRADMNRVLDDWEINRLKRVMVDRLFEESGRLTSDETFEYRLAFKVFEACNQTWLTCWLE